MIFETTTFWFNKESSFVSLQPSHSIGFSTSTRIKVPIERLLGLSTLMLYTAAGVTPDGVIPGLEEDAQQLRDELSKREGDDGV